MHYHPLVSCNNLILKVSVLTIALGVKNRGGGLEEGMERHVASNDEKTLRSNSSLYFQCCVQ